MTLSQTAKAMAALSDVTRLRIVQELLKAGELNVGQIVSLLGVSQPSVSKHLRILREAGIVASEKHRTTVICRVVTNMRAAYSPLSQLLTHLQNSAA